MSQFQRMAESIIWEWLRERQEEPGALIADMDAGDVVILASSLAFQLDPELRATMRGYGSSRPVISETG